MPEGVTLLVALAGLCFTQAQTCGFLPVFTPVGVVKPLQGVWGRSRGCLHPRIVWKSCSDA